MKFPTLLKMSGALALNLTLFGYGVHSNNKHKKWLESAGSDKKRNLAVRDYALRENAYYQSEVPCLRILAIRDYEANKHLKIKTSLEYEEIVHRKNKVK